MAATKAVEPAFNLVEIKYWTTLATILISAYPPCDRPKSTYGFCQPAQAFVVINCSQQGLASQPSQTLSNLEKCPKNPSKSDPIVPHTAGMNAPGRFKF
jgi:hypothetical protein